MVIPHEPFADNRDPISPEDVRRVVEEKIYWTNEARAWKERAQELMAALREIAEYVTVAPKSTYFRTSLLCTSPTSHPLFQPLPDPDVHYSDKIFLLRPLRIKHLPSDVEAILNVADVRDMSVGPVSLTLQSPRFIKKKSAKKRKEPVEIILSDDSTDKKKRKAAAVEALRRLSQFLILPQGVDVFLESIPNIEVKNSIFRTPALKKLLGPAGGTDVENQDDKEALQSYGELVSGLSVSTYPFLEGAPSGPKIQAGSPNCDFFSASIFGGGVVACVTDGCGWGNRSQTASRQANQTFVNVVEQHLPMVSDFQQGALLLMRAVQAAHEKIVEGAKRAWEVGTTTLCGGVLFQVADDQVQEFGAQYAFLSVNLGDCKAYYCTQRTAGGEVKRPNPSGSSSSISVPRSLNASSASVGSNPAAPHIGSINGNSSSTILESSAVGPGHLTSSSPSRDQLFPQRLRWNVSDITTGNRISDAKMTGGHLGPVSRSEPNEASLTPDLGNFTIHVTPCSKGDMLVLVSDGVHDNLDPETLNLDPVQAGLDYTTWAEIPLDEKIRAKDIYRADIIAQHVDNTRSPSEIAVNMLKWVRKVTENKRLFMESNPGKEEPAELPGKMDHTTVVVFSVD